MDFNNLSSHHLSLETREELQQLVAPLVERTYTDEAFKAEFIANPFEVIQRETGASFELPDKVEFKVLDQSNPYAIYIPLLVNEDALELTDEELEMIAGGEGDNNGVCIRINIRGINLKKGCSAND
ncbi:MAG: NHLP leader peptide family RiPP precursor [Bacteroidota bacterium]